MVFALFGIYVLLQVGYCWTQVNFKWTLCDVRLLLAPTYQ